MHLQNKTSSYTSFRVLLLSLISITALRIVLIDLEVWPINGDEAQYWDWSQHLAWGYYSKPPMVAWLISLSTGLLGHGAVGLRLASPLCHLVTAIMIFFAARQLFNQTIGFWSGLTFSLLPAVSFSATLISTDPPLLMFWSITLLAVIKALETKNLIWWWGAGLSLGLAFYSKYAAVLFWVCFMCLLLIEKNYRSLLKTPGPYLLVIVPMVMLIPNLLWNMQHHFVSFLAVKENASLNQALFHPIHLVEFLLSQSLMLGPVLFVIFCVILCQRSLLSDARLRFLLAFSLPILLIMSLEALLVRAHTNWSAPAYVAATILVVAVLVKQQKIVWLKIALLSHLLFILLFTQLQPLVRALHIHVHQQTTITGWKQLKPAIKQMHQLYPQAKIIVNDRMLLTQLLYFQQFPRDKVIRWHPGPGIHDHYELISQLKPSISDEYLFFSYHKLPKKVLNRFKIAQKLTILTLETYDGQQLPLFIYHFTGFKGYHY